MTESSESTKSLIDQILLETILGCNYQDQNNSVSFDSSAPEESDQLAKVGSNITSFCPRIFDGWSCWNATPAGQTAYAPCPWFIAGFDPSRLAHKECLEGGEWFRHPESGNVWSNYTNCVDIQALHRYQSVTMVYEVGYVISLVALITSLAILCSFRSLWCARVSIHKHLFTSFIINNSLWIAWYHSVSNNEDAPVNTLNQPLCIGLHVLVHYFLLANYFWMFCEGLYLHTLLVYAFHANHKTLLHSFIAFGWAGPALPIALYTYFRATDPNIQQHQDCWIDESRWSLILSIPVCVCLIMSLLFLLNILRVLLLKLNSSSSASASAAAASAAAGHSQGSRRLWRRSVVVAGGDRRESAVSENLSSLRKAFRATLILIPLLGVHYLIIPFRPAESDSGYFLVYQYMSAVSSSLQGLAVAILFCFANNDVIAILKRKVFSRFTCFSKNDFTNNTRRRRNNKPQQQQENNNPTQVMMVVVTNNNSSRSHLPPTSSVVTTAGATQEETHNFISQV